MTRLRWAFIVFGLFGAGEIIYVLLWMLISEEKGLALGLGRSGPRELDHQGADAMNLEEASPGCEP